MRRSVDFRGSGCRIGATAWEGGIHGLGEEAVESPARAMIEAVPNERRIAPRRRPFQFSLRTLLLLPVLCALGCCWYVQHRQYENARVAYESAWDGYNNGLGMPLEVCQASLTLCEADQRCLFATTYGARSRHLARVTRLERAWSAMCRLSMTSKEGRDAALEQLRRIGECRTAAAEQLHGVRAD